MFTCARSFPPPRTRSGLGSLCLGPDSPIPHTHTVFDVHSINNLSYTLLEECSRYSPEPTIGEQGYVNRYENRHHRPRTLWQAWRQRIQCCDKRNNRFPRSLSSRWNFYNIVIIPIEYGSRKVDFHFSGKNGRKNVTTVRNFYHLTLSHSKRIFRGKKSLMPFIYSNGMINWSTFLQCHFIVRFWATRM